MVEYDASNVGTGVRFSAPAHDTKMIPFWDHFCSSLRGAENRTAEGVGKPAGFPWRKAVERSGTSENRGFPRSEIAERLRTRTNGQPQSVSSGAVAVCIRGRRIE